MYISDKFKRYLNTLPQNRRDTIGLGDSFTKTNEIVIAKFGALIMSNSNIYRKTIMSEDGQQYDYRYIADGIQTIKGIDDEFIRCGSKLFRFEGIVEFIISQLGDLEEKIFEAGMAVKVVGTMKLRGMQLTNLMEQTGKYYVVVDYDSTYSTTSYRGIIVKVKDVYENILYIPQRALEKTNYTDIKELYINALKRQIKNQITDAKKSDIVKLTQDYQAALRVFMNISKLLAEANTEDIDALVEAQVKTIQTFEKSFENVPQIKTARLISNDEIEVYTKVLFSEQDQTMPIGRYKIRLKLKSRDLKIYNIDLSLNENQHMHVNDGGYCCLGQRENLLRRSYSKGDYYVLILGIIEYLEHYNADSPYIGRDDFQARNKNKINKALEIEGQVRGLPPVVEKVIKRRVRRTPAQIQADRLAGGVGRGVIPVGQPVVPTPSEQVEIDAEIARVEILRTEAHQRVVSQQQPITIHHTI